LENKEEMANQIRRILKPLGRVVVVDWKNTIKNPVSSDWVKENFTVAQLAFEKEIDAGDHHFGLIFRKHV
jgi:ubiquinone/menaquinone biosynthesis C-methylase UbiE